MAAEGTGGLLVRSPLAGHAIDLAQVPDAVFAERMMGDGAAIEPDGDGVATVVAPFDATVTRVFPGGHAIVFDTEAGPMLLHIGIDTVKLEGAGFRARVADGDRVAVGDPLLEVDLGVIRSRGVSLATPVVAIEGQTVSSVIPPGAAVVAGDPLFEVAPPA